MIKKYNITVNGESYNVEVEELDSVSQAPSSRMAAPSPKPATPVAPKSATPAPTNVQSQGGNNSVVAPMPGTISDVKVGVGQSIKKGDVLVVLEAMKMENEIMAPADGTISAINVSKGASVSSGDTLVTLG